MRVAGRPPSPVESISGKYPRFYTGINIGTLLTASAHLLPRVIMLLHQQRPNVSIVVRDGTNDFLMPLLHSGDLDMVVGRLAEYRYREKLTQEVLYQEEIVVVARKGHPLCKRSNVPFDELIESDWILPPTQTTLRRQIDKEFLDRNLSAPSNPVECVSFLTNRSILLETDMIGVFPFHVVQREIKNGEFATVKCKLNISKSPVGVSYRTEDALSPAATAFLAQIRATSDELQG